MSRLVIKGHQQSMGRFVQGVEGQPAPGIGNRLLKFGPILVKVAYGYVRDPVTLLALRMIFSLPFFLLATAWSALRAHTANASTHA